MIFQEIFDTAARGIISQGGPSYVGKSLSISCRYRVGDRKCAAGWLIPDEAYEANFEGHSWSIVPYSLNFDEEQNAFIAQLQNIHDGAAFRKVNDGEDFFALWKPEMRALAAWYDLDPSVLD